MAQTAITIGGAVLEVGGAAFVEGVVTASGWQTLKVGSGGFVRGMNIAPDGTMVARTDTNGAYYYNGTNWVQLFNSSTLPSSFLNGNDLQIVGQGCFEIQVAPTNTQIFYAAYGGYVWVSSNRGTTWTQTNFPQNGNGVNSGGMIANDNTNYAQMGPRMAVDPNNSNIVFVGTENAGVSYTTNGGSSWTQISNSNLPYGTGPGITGLLFYGNGSVISNVTQTIYAVSSGNGVYVSNNAGATWTLTTGTPTTVYNAAIDSSGNYYAGNGGGLYKYSAGSWTTCFTDGNGIEAVAINPFNISEIVAIRPSGWVNVSYNAGSSWSSANYVTTAVSTDIPWLAGANTVSGQIFLDVGQAAFSPVTNGSLMCSAGTGTWQMTMPSSGFTQTTPISWNDFSAGIEQLVANQIVIPPVSNSTPILASWDRPFFNITSLTSYPSTYGPVASANIIAGWGIDYASSNPSYVFGWASTNSTNESGYTTNNGVSWTNFPTQFTTANGGSVAASSPTNVIVSPAYGYWTGQPGYTLDGGNTWTGITISGISSWSGFYASYTSDLTLIAADRVNANTFYLYYPAYGVYISTNGGAAWTQQKSGSIDGYSGFTNAMRSVPGNAGHLFYTPGIQSGQTLNTSGTAPFSRSTNSGVTWTTVSNVLGVLAFNFGAVANGYTYPSIYIVGYVGGVWGVWYSLDNASTWTTLGNPFQSSTLEYISCIATDPNSFGYVYVGTRGGGYVYYHP